MKNTNSIFLQYLGVSAFVISDGAGTSLALDLWTKGAFPYAEDTPEDPGLGETPGLSALLVSHDHKDHAFVPSGIPVIYGVQAKKVVDDPHVSQVGNFAIGRFSSQHFASDAKRSKANAIFVLDVSGVKIVHLGDAHGTMADGYLLGELKQKIGDIDVLLIPIGSPWLKPVDVRVLDLTIGILNPKVSLPMHYWTLADKAAVLSGLSGLGCQLLNMPGNRVEFDSESLPERNARTVWNLPAGRFQPVENLGEKS